MTTAATLFQSLDLPDEQRLMVVLGIMQMLPEMFEEKPMAKKIDDKEAFKWFVFPFIFFPLLAALLIRGVIKGCANAIKEVEPLWCWSNWLTWWRNQ